MRRAPVPEMDCVMASRSSAELSLPYASRPAALVNSGMPVMPAYSLFSREAMILSSALRTDGRT